MNGKSANVGNNITFVSLHFCLLMKLYFIISLTSLSSSLQLCYKGAQAKTGKTLSFQMLALLYLIQMTSKSISVHRWVGIQLGAGSQCISLFSMMEHVK